MIGIEPALRDERAQGIINRIDAGAGPGLLEVWSGGRPDSGNTNVSNIPAYAVSTAYAINAYVNPSNGHYYRANNAGTSAGTAPAWPTNGSTVTDNDIVWQDMGELPVKLGTLTFSDPCGSVTNGVISFDSIAQDAFADASGTATWVKVTDSDGNPVITLNVGINGSGAGVEINTTSIVQDGAITANSSSITEGGDYRTT